MNSEKRKQGLFYFSVCGAMLVLLIICIFVICSSCSGRDISPAVLSGDWRYDEQTVYEFDGKGSGCMLIDGTDHYEFSYQIEDGVLKIDYSLDYVTDCEYSFKVSDNTLTLIGGNGTAEPGKEYLLIKE